MKKIENVRRLADEVEKILTVLIFFIFSLFPSKG